MGHLNFKRLSFAASGTGSRQATLGHHNSKGISGGFFVTKHETHFYAEIPSSSVTQKSLARPFKSTIFGIHFFLFVCWFVLHPLRFVHRRAMSWTSQSQCLSKTELRVWHALASDPFMSHCSLIWKKHGKSWNILKQKHISKTPDSYNRLMCIIHGLS